MAQNKFYKPTVAEFLELFYHDHGFIGTTKRERIHNTKMFWNAREPQWIVDNTKVKRGYYDLEVAYEQFGMTGENWAFEEDREEANEEPDEQVQDDVEVEGQEETQEGEEEVVEAEDDLPSDNITAVFEEGEPNQEEILEELGLV